MKVLVNSISTLINIRLTEFRSEMISMKNKNGDQSVFLGDRDSDQTEKKA